jgi:hypothetical protein
MIVLRDILVPLWTKRGLLAGMDWDERPVLITLEAQGTVMRGQVRSLTVTSAQIISDGPCLLCNKVRANVRFRAEDIIYSLSGMAISSECDESIILYFDDVTRQDMAMLRSLGVKASAAPHQRQVQVPPPSVGRKRSKAEQRVVLHHPPPGGIERRVLPRYELETVATLVILDKGLALKTTVLEVSQSGCRLFSDTPFNLPLDARVEVEFVGLGQPFRLAAEIRLKKDEHLLGLSFAPMSCRCKDRLLEMIGELAEKASLV